MNDETLANPQITPPLSLAVAAKVSGVSAVTLRKHLTAGRLSATKLAGGKHGATWSIEPAELAAFVARQYGRTINLLGLPATDTTITRQDTPAKPANPATTDELAELRQRLDETLLDLGRYRALAAAGEETNAKVEELLKERIAELQHERDEAAGELAQLRARGFFARLFGSG